MDEKESIDGALPVNTLSEAFLEKWDRQLSDDNRCYGIKLCLAGAESKKVRDGLYRIGVSNILVSYYYLRSWLKNRSVQEIAEDFGRFKFVFLDSGGFTMIQEIQKKGSTALDPREYTEKYYEDLKKFGHVFAGCAEVDLPTELGLEYSEESKHRLLEAGVPIVPVIQGEKVEHYEGLGWFTDYPYISIGSKFIENRDYFGYVNEIQSICRERNVLIHGLGATDADTMLRARFYSVDSSVGSDSVVWVRMDGDVRRVRIGDLYEDVGESFVESCGGRAVCPENIETLTVAGSPKTGYQQVWSKLKSVVKHIVAKPRVRISVQGGRILEVTTDHSLFKITSYGELVETKPSSLSVGDWIVCSRGFVWSGEGIFKKSVVVQLPVTTGRGRRWHNECEKKIDFEFTDRFLELVGFWIGDGSYTGDTTVCFSCGIDSEPVDLVVEWATSIGRKATVSRKKDVQVSHSEVVRGLRELGLVGHSSDKRLPDWFWCLSEDQACCVLRGLFTADGSGTGRPYLATISRELAEQVHDALTSLLGIPVTVQGLSTEGPYRVSLSTWDSIRIFSKKIGFFVERKQAAIYSGQLGRGSRMEEVPRELCSDSIRYSKSTKVESNRVSRMRSGAHPSVLSEDLLYLPISSIEELSSEEKDVYDLEVPGTERFIANGVLAHNTTWLGGARFGNTMYFENGRIRYADKENKHIRKRFKKRFEENGLVWEDIEKDKQSEVNLMNALAWKQLADYVKYSAQKCYWLTPDEKDKALTLQSKAFNAEGILNRKVSIERAQVRRLAAVHDPEYDDRAHEVLHCDTCHMTGKCPRFKAGQPCGYDINVQIASQADLQKMLRIILEAQYGRVMTGVLFEKLEGGVLNKDVSVEVQRLVALVGDVKGIFKKEPEAEMTIHAKGSGGTLANMMAAVFSKRGTGGSGSGNTRVQRESNKIIDVPSEKE